MPQVLLLEIGTEELPATFVAAGVDALSGLLARELQELRLAHGAIHTAGTPRRLAVWAESVADAQPDLDEEVIGPPTRVAFDADGKPTKAAAAFAQKIGVAPEALGRKPTDKGEYVVGQRREKGRAATELLAPALSRICGKIPFRKSMRWSDGDTAFGRPVRWLVGLFGGQELRVEFAGLTAAKQSFGHRFLAPAAFEIPEASAYVALLREHHVVVELTARRNLMVERLREAAVGAGTTLIEDDFLVEENLSLVEEPQVVVGGFEAEFLALPERVILDVAKGHQRYFGARSPDGKLAAKYLAVVNTALDVDNVRRGNDRVMRARLADAKFFYDTDLATPLGDRRKALAGVMFHKKLGSVEDKVTRIEALVPKLGAELGLEKSVIDAALAGAALAKCDLVTLMVGELPELQGEMGTSYALAQGIPAAVARVSTEHYRPRGADDPTAESAAGALVGLCDRLDTLAGCFGIGQIPTGAADPLALRRAALGALRTVLDKDWNLSLASAIRAAYEGHAKLDATLAETEEKLGAFLKQRLRGLLEQSLPTDAVDACLDASADRPRDVALRARALSAIDPTLRASAGEVFKRAANIAKDAPDGEPRPPADVTSDVHASEDALFAAFRELRARVDVAQRAAEYEPALAAIAGFAPVLGKYFDDVMVMAEDAQVRENRLKLMRQIQRACSSIASFNLLAR